MDIQRLLAAQMHSSITVDQALSSSLLTDVSKQQKCAREGCLNWFVPHSNQKYCRDLECLWQRGVIAAREKNARRKARGVA